MNHNDNVPRSQLLATIIQNENNKNFIHQKIASSKTSKNYGKYFKNLLQKNEKKEIFLLLLNMKNNEISKIISKLLFEIERYINIQTNAKIFPL